MNLKCIEVGQPVRLRSSFFHPDEIISSNQIHKRPFTPSEAIKSLAIQSFLTINIPNRSPQSSGLSRLRDESRTHKIWFDDFDFIDIERCSRCEFDAFFISAPTQFTQGMLYGKLTLRIQNSIISGCDFFNHSDHSDSFVESKELIHRINNRMLALSETFQEWFEALDFIDPDFCSRSELEEMILTAPIAFLEGVMFGKLSTRIQMAASTGKRFD